MNKTNIAWTDYTWNPITGCTAVSDGCKNCYAKIVHERFYDTPFSEIAFHANRLSGPAKVKKPAKIFVGSMTDLFQDDISFHFIDRIIRTILDNPQHTFQILTKRPDRMKEYFTERYKLDFDINDEVKDKLVDGIIPNLWLGVTVESEKELDRVRTLVKIPTVVHFISVEPMIGEINFTNYYFQDKRGHHPFPYLSESAKTKLIEMLDWVIVGGESGAKSKVRKMESEWVRKLYLQCVDNNTPFFFKQWGAHKPKYNYDFELVRQFPS